MASEFGWPVRPVSLVDLPRWVLAEANGEHVKPDPVLLARARACANQRHRAHWTVLENSIVCCGACYWRGVA